MPVNVFFWINPVRSVIKMCVPHSRMSMGAPQIQFSSEVMMLENASMFFLSPFFGGTGFRQIYGILHNFRNLLLVPLCGAALHTLFPRFQTKKGSEA